MSDRSRIETFAVAGALLLCAAFVISFALGLGRGRDDTPMSRPVADRAGSPAPGAGRLEVLNASGRGGMARTATQRLRTAGFDVVYYGNAPASAGDSSVVIARVDSDAVARAAAGRLGIQRTTTQLDTTLFVDATVIVGRDWLLEPSAQEGGAERGSRLRRWLGLSR